MHFLLNLVILGVLGFAAVKVMKWGTNKGRAYRSKFVETCPRCRKAVTFTPKPCQNCASTSPQFQYRGEPDVPLNQVCGDCMTATPYFAECPTCHANLGWRFANKIKPSEAIKGYMKR